MSRCTSARVRVAAFFSRLSRRLACTVAWASVLGAGASCVEIHGGAIEVAWVIFAPGGRAIRDCACAEPPIAEVRLELASTSDGSNPCAGASSCRFPCAQQTGSTPFNIPPGDYSMRLTAMGGDGSDLGAAQGFRSTPPTLWPVVRGQPTELDALTIEAPCSAACNGQSNTEPCARP